MEKSQLLLKELERTKICNAGFSCHDAEIMRVRKESETIPTYACAIIAILEILITVVAIDVINHRSFKEKISQMSTFHPKVHKTLSTIAYLSALKSLCLGFFSVLVTLLLTVVGKKTGILFLPFPPISKYPTRKLIQDLKGRRLRKAEPSTPRNWGNDFSSS